ncbi:MAG: RIP metalloprotease RseP [Defluviitaleaceae bacterium]|nr:RIP metalloprotease RseP [Defluviitaleaceae bacterium]
MTIVYAILVFLLLIFVHEFGHLISAKLCGIRVNEFALGMGPKLIGFTKGETKYSFRAVPFGGYCLMEGEDEESDDPRAFGNKPVRIRALVLFAGSLMNILLAVVLLSLLIFSIGTPTRVLADVGTETPAYAAGLRPGDELVSINGTPVKEWDEISPILNRIANEVPEAILVVTVLRDGAERTIETHLYEDANGNLKLGISPEFARSPGLFFQSFGYGARATFLMGQMMYKVLGELFTGKAGMDQLTGPVGIVVVVGDTARLGFGYLIQLTALISLNLAIINLLPFPALDGGRLVFLAIRKATGKTITDTIEGRVHLIGIIVLFAFMALITMQDIGRFFFNS